MDRKRKVEEDNRPAKRHGEILWRGHWEYSGGEWNYLLPDGRVVYYQKYKDFYSW